MRDRLIVRGTAMVLRADGGVAVYDLETLLPELTDLVEVKLLIDKIEEKLEKR